MGAAGAKRRASVQQAGRTLRQLGCRRLRNVESRGDQETSQPAGDDLRRQFHQLGDQRRTGGVGLAGDLRPGAGGKVVQRVPDLLLDEAALLLDHQQRPLAAREVAETLGLQRPRHRNLIDRDLRTAIEAQRAQRVQRVLVRLADGDQPDRGVRFAAHQPVQPVRACPGKRGRQPLLRHAALQIGTVGGKAHMRIVVEAVWRPDDRRCGEAAVGGNRDGGRLLHRLRRRLQRDPQPGVTRQRDPGQAEIDQLLGRGRVQHRHKAALEDVFALMRIGGGVRAMVVARHRQQTAARRGAEHVTAMECIAGAIDAGTLAVPNAEDAIDRLAREGVKLLRAVQDRRREVLVQPRLEADVVGFQQLLPPPQFQVQSAERRAAIARDQPGRGQPRGPVQPRLLQHQPDQRLDAGQQHRSVEIDETGLQTHGRAAETDVHLPDPSLRRAALRPSFITAKFR